MVMEKIYLWFSYGLDVADPRGQRIGTAIIGGSISGGTAWLVLTQDQKDMAFSSHVHRNAPITWSSRSASRRANTRRIVDSVGRPPVPTPNPASAVSGLVGDPFTDRGERARTGQDRRQTDGQDHRQPVAHPATVPRVRH